MVTYSIYGTGYVDFGLKTKINQTPVPKESLLVDTEGKELIFNSYITLMNTMSKQGWKMEDQMSSRFPVIASQKLDIRFNDLIVWIMSKEVTTDEEIPDGFMKKGMWEIKHPKK